MIILSQPSQEKLNELRDRLGLLLPRVEDNPLLVDFLLKKVWEDILIYCHIEDLPEELENTLIEMVFSNLTTYRWLDTQEDIEDGRIKEISEGDLTIKKLTTEEASKINASVKGISIPYQYKLNSFRRVSK